MTTALVIALAVWLGFSLFLGAFVAIGEWWDRREARRRRLRDFDCFEWVWLLPPAERHNDRRAA